MLSHNLSMIFRNLKWQKSSFFINLFGLSIGIAATLLIYLWVTSELSVDGFHENDSQLYQVMINQDFTDKIVTQSATPDQLAEALADEVPEIMLASAATPPNWFGKFSLFVENNDMKAIGQFVGQDFFKMFSFKLLEGNKDQVLADKNGIVISKALSQKLFGTTENVVGKSLEWSMLFLRQKHTVSGVFDDLPSNSTLQFDFLVPFEAFKDISKMIGRPVNWESLGVNTYVTLNKEAKVDEVNDKIASFVKNRAENSNISLFLTPFSDGYLHNNYENGVQAGGRIEYVKLFSIIAIFILLMACINFINLSTAKAARRAKEVGVKKAIGVERGTLISQFLGESFVVTAISLVLAVGIVLVALPKFNQITGKELALNLDLNLALLLLGITVFTGLVSGSYPALYLSSFDPVTVLKGKLNKSFGELWARRGLVVFQFSLSVILIVAVIVVLQQMQFIQSKNLGYNKDNIIYFSKEGRVMQNPEAFMTELKKVNGVKNASFITQNITDIEAFTEGLSWPGKAPSDNVKFHNLGVDFGMIETLGMEVSEGRAFSKEFGAENEKLLFNETAIRLMGIEDPVGKSVNLWGKDMTIIGIVKDFHFKSFHQAVSPLFIRMEPMRTMLAMAKIEAGTELSTINAIQTFYKKYTGSTFEYKFLDETFQAQYVAENRVASLSKYFAGLAIFISCLGLFGLAAYATERRTKEIGIRKALGSSNFDIIFLLSKDFAKIVFLAIVIGLPISYYLVRNWLDGFAYRVELGIGIFLFSGLAAMVISLLTVYTQALKAARMDPLISLKANE